MCAYTGSIKLPFRNIWIPSGSYRLPSLLNRRLQDIAVLMYKVKNDLAPTIINELFKQTNPRYSLSLRNTDYEIPIKNGKHYPLLILRTSPMFKTR